MARKNRSDVMICRINSIGYLGILVMGLCAFCLATAPSTPKRVSEEGYLSGSGGVRLFYRKAGNAADYVIFLHGGPGGSMHDGGFSMDPLSEHHTLIMYDQRGGGRSELLKDKALLTAADNVRDLEAVRQHFGAEKMTLIGLSWGSGLAALYTDAHPDHVSRIVFLDPMPVALNPYARARSDKTDSLFSAADTDRLEELDRQAETADDTQLKAICLEQDRISFKPYISNPTNYDRNRSDACDDAPAAIRNAPLVNAAVVGSLGNFDLRPLLAKLQVPVLVIEGEETNVPLDSTREWAKAPPDAQLLLIPHAGHATFVDQPAVLVRDIEMFFQGKWPATSTKLSRIAGTSEGVLAH
jgi:proline iminopeptidase